MSSSSLPPPNPPRSWADYLRRPEDERYSLRQLGKRTGLTHSFVAKIARGERLPSAATAKKLHRETQIPYDALLEKPKRRKRRKP